MNTCSGYISPEYANYGLYSLKSDVFSYKSRGFRHPDHHLNLIEHVGLDTVQTRQASGTGCGSKVETPYLSEMNCLILNNQDSSLRGILLKQAIHRGRANYLRRTLCSVSLLEAR
ncbi:hypothetical protein NC653_024161 [Populus alba x Populus x berolinensis]|uniref:Uncharacterized protein n=1 Tax=Populus alba x Populus x berolinensis TaxID=444605 RepID=A0AAD6Q6I2_9ROSI|nr:hypothetical protein NC653_024161 [Populus alba x Populus x berolinensis]